MKSPDIKDVFNIASSLTKEQKQALEVRLLKDERTKNRIAEQMQARDDAIRVLREQQEKEAKKIADREIQKRIQPKPEPKPVTAIDTRTLEQRIEAVQKEVSEKLSQHHQKALDSLAEKHNAQIDHALKAAQTVQRGQLAQKFNLKAR